MIKDFDKIYCLDTNIILSDASNIFKISSNSKNLVVIPETVIDEIDSKKTGVDEINFQAREFGRLLSDGKIIGVNQHQTKTITSILVKDAKIDIISFKKYDLQDVDKSIINDRKIIEVAKFAKYYYGKPNLTSLITNDVMCCIRAISEGIDAQNLSKNKDVPEINFIRHIDKFDSKLFSKMQHQPITDFVSDHKHDNYCYLFTCTDGNEKIAYIVNERINFITDELFEDVIIKPLNVGQKFSMAGMLDDRIDICVVEALAGSGKTLLAVAAGINKVKNNVFDKVVYIRNSVESVDKAEEVGFLPGLESKFMIYNFPLLDTLDFISKKDKTTKKDKRDESRKDKGSVDSDISEFDDMEKLRELQKIYKVETIWPGSLRGRTISNSFVIIDEDQNFSKKSLQTVMSRLDSNCKVVCIGSNRQIDHPYINKYTNGLNCVLKATKEEDESVVMFGSELNKVVRGRITEWAERVFEK